ncbi:formate dehydrogenase subunit beta [Paracoccus suum]|uniref:Formate dehydrogenase subunit beta n=1 Tax=Paracoccus suum TaxID=2259340 RepID=A0A344PHR5_9RHOB|nr:formate dehydrogenase subunit beta [Paracoccus suum]AXC48920.1 formate dehydrogenase subunit beta [Paracoccus suum]
MTTQPASGVAEQPTTAVSNPVVAPLGVGFDARDVVRISATMDVPAPERQLEKVAKLIDVSKCIGCKACQSACIEWNDTHPAIEENVGHYENPHDLTPEMFTLMRFNEWVNPETDNLEWLIRKDGCMHCEDPGCLKACPAPGAIVQYSNGIVDFITDNCIGCGYCITGCPFNIPRVSEVTHKSHKCTLCSDRVAVGQGPACAKACPTQAIVFGTKEDMVAHAEERVADLKSRGYDNAGIYDPAGVGGTHVFYVLQHADKPQIYNDLPSDPKIAASVEVWKGPAKTAGLAAIALAAVGSAVMGLTTRANRVRLTDEREAEELVEVEHVVPAGKDSA